MNKDRSKLTIFQHNGLIEADENCFVSLRLKNTLKKEYCGNSFLGLLYSL